MRVRARAASQYPLDRLEVVLNGRVAATIKADRGESIAMTRPSRSRRADGSVRVTGPPHPDHPGSSLFAHTSAVYLEVPDKPVSARADADIS